MRLRRYCVWAHSDFSCFQLHTLIYFMHSLLWLLHFVLVERQFMSLVHAWDSGKKAQASYAAAAIWYLLSFGRTKCWGCRTTCCKESLHSLLPHSRMSARARACVCVCVCLVAIECESGFFLRFYGFQFSLIKPAESAICSRIFYSLFEHHVQHDE